MANLKFTNLQVTQKFEESLIGKDHLEVQQFLETIPANVLKDGLVALKSMNGSNCKKNILDIDEQIGVSGSWDSGIKIKWKNISNFIQCINFYFTAFNN
ncbi:17582_t:CDS:2 [Rhizophagus irregularis]|nr:17582_t:CDS:2 [Rhizophagus irregularis]